MEKFLETERTYLRFIKLEDAERVRDLCNTEKIFNTTLFVQIPYTIEHAKAFIEKVHKRVTEKDDIVLGIILKETNEFIGVVDLMRNTKHNNGEIGYWLGFDYWGKGIMTEVVKAFTEYCLKELKLHRLVIKVFTFNPASAKVAIKSGYEYEGCNKEVVLKDGKYYDTETYALINKEN